MGIPTQKVLFGVPRFTAELTWTDLAAELPGWEISVCPRGEIADHVQGVDVVCPWGSPVDAGALEAGTFGLVQQFGVDPDDNGLERFLTATRRQNFLIPPRRNRAFPLVELA